MFVEFFFSQTYKYFNKYNIKTEEKRALLKLQGAQHKNSKSEFKKKDIYMKTQKLQKKKKKKKKLLSQRRIFFITCKNMKFE